MRSCVVGLTAAAFLLSPAAHADAQSEPAGGLTISVLAADARGHSGPSVRATPGSSCTTRPDRGGFVTVCADHGYPLPTPQRLGVVPGETLLLRFGQRVKSPRAELRSLQPDETRPLRAQPFGDDGHFWTVRLPRRGPLIPRLGVFVLAEGAAGCCDDADFEAGLEDLTPTPVRARVVRGQGLALDAFRIRYRSGGPGLRDTVQVTGPRGTRCAQAALIARTGLRPGVQTIDVGPRVRRSQDGRRFAFRPRNGARKRWCPGVYRGTVERLVRHNHKIVIGRFAFRVKAP